MNYQRYLPRMILRLTLFLLLVVWLSTTFVGTQIASSSAPTDLTTDIDQIVQEGMTLHRLPGVAIVIVRGDETLYLKEFGFASLLTHSLVSPQTVFDLASCSKSFTALAVLLLWHDGLIDLDKPYVCYVPEFRLAEEDASNKITVCEFLNQTSGLPGTFSEPVAYYQGSNAMQQVVGAMRKIHIKHAPGTTFEYTNLNYSLLGALVERVSGQAFEDFVQERIFTPLGMVHSTLRPEEAARFDRADGHQLMLGRVVARQVPVYRSVTPAGWVMSSAEDMGKWLSVNVNDGMIDGKQIFPAELMTMIHQTGVNMTKDGASVGYGMGWFTGVNDDGSLVLWHGGDTPNFLTDMILLPEQKLGILMLANGQTSLKAHQIATDIASRVAGKKVTQADAPWWSSWKSIDDIAIWAMIVSGLLILGLIPFIWWQVRIISHHRKKNIDMPKQTGKRIKLLWIVLPATPWALLVFPAAGSFIAMQTMFGLNIFGTLIRTGYFSPPGALIAAVAILVSIFLWAIALSITTILRAIVRADV